MKKQKGGAPFKFSLPRRLLVVFLAFVMLPYAVGMVFAMRMAQNAIPGAEQAYKTRVAALAEQLDTELSRIESQVYYNIRRTPLQYMSLVTDDFSFPEIYDSVVDTRDIVYALRNSSGLLEKSTVYFPLIGRKISSDGSFVPFTEKDKQFLEMYQQREDMGFLATIDGGLCMLSDSRRVAGSARKANSPDAAVLRLDFSDRALEQWCDIFPQESQICLIGAPWNGEPYFLSAGETRYSPAVLKKDMVDLISRQPDDADTSVLRMDGEETLRIVCRVGQRSLWVGSYMDAAILKSATSTFTIWQIVLTAFLLLQVGVFFYLMRRMVAQPINRFAGEVQRLEKEGMLQLAETPANDMDFLYEAFLGVSGKLKAALEQSYKNKVLIYQAEIKYLQAQVNPHFLYNSFYHLYRMAKMEDNEGVAEMSRRLSSYYRYITRSDQNEVPLEMEYQNIVDYTDIQTIRFGDRIQVELEPLPDAYKNLTVPRFVLQPLFENAYYHGVEKQQSGRIRLQFRPEPGALVILVENNGACTDEELAAITQYLTRSEAGEKITALKNVKGRMRLLGGDLSISRGSLGGFCAALTLPCKNMNPVKEEKDENAADRG